MTLLSCSRYTTGDDYDEDGGDGERLNELAAACVLRCLGTLTYEY